MSDGNEFQRSDAATGNVHRPTVVSRDGGTTNVMITSNVGDERIGRRYEQYHSGMAARDHAVARGDDMPYWR